jgi:hypothetical protein
MPNRKDRIAAGSFRTAAGFGTLVSSLSIRRIAMLVCIDGMSLLGDYVSEDQDSDEEAEYESEEIQQGRALLSLCHHLVGFSAHRFYFRLRELR